MCGNSAIVQNWINTSTLVDYNLSNIFSNVGLIKGWHDGLGAAMCIEYSSCFHILISSSHQVWLKRFVVYLVFFLPTIFWLLLPTAQAVVHHALLVHQNDLLLGWQTCASTLPLLALEASFSSCWWVPPSAICYWHRWYQFLDLRVCLLVNVIFATGRTTWIDSSLHEFFFRLILAADVDRSFGKWGLEHVKLLYILVCDLWLDFYFLTFLELHIVFFWCYIHLSTTWNSYYQVVRTMEPEFVKDVAGVLDKVWKP
jgi:hypothetical protein